MAYQADETVCKKCGRATRVTHTYHANGKIIRRRQCKPCRLTFKTEANYEKRIAVAR